MQMCGFLFKITFLNSWKSKYDMGKYLKRKKIILRILMNNFRLINPLSIETHWILF